jgi:DNA-binding MarR family transcriptional regulator
VPLRLADRDGLPVLDATPGHLIRCAQQIHSNLWVRHIGVDMTSVQYALLLVVRDLPGADQRMIGDRVSLDKSTTADVVQRLARRGLVSRARPIEDGRRRRVDLTDTGRELLVDAAPGVVKVQQEILAPLTLPEREALLVLLRQVAYRGDPPHPDPSDDHDAIVNDGLPPLERIRLPSTPGHLIRRAQQVHTTLWTERVAQDLTSVQYNVLLVLHARPGIDQRTLGRYAWLDRSTGADVIRRMVRNRLLIRARDQDDGRRNMLELSAVGRDVLHQRAPAVIDVQHELLRWLSSAERERFLSLMTRLVHDPR